MCIFIVYFVGKNIWGHYYIWLVYWRSKNKNKNKKIQSTTENRIAAVHQSIQIQQPTATIKRESTENEKNSTQTPTKVTEIAHSAIKTNKLRLMPQPPTKNQ